MHPQTNPLNRKFLEIIYEKTPDSLRDTYNNTLFLKDIFKKCGYSISQKSLTVNQFHAFLRWCFVRQILRKKREGKFVAYKINPEKFNYYLWRLKQDGAK